MRHSAAAAVERHVRQLDMGDQDVDVLDRVLAVAFDDARGGPFHHVDGRFVLGHVMAKLRRLEHHVVAQVIGLGEAGVIVGGIGSPGRYVEISSRLTVIAGAHILTSSRPG